MVRLRGRSREILIPVGAIALLVDCVYGWLSNGAQNATSAELIICASMSAIACTAGAVVGSVEFFLRKRRKTRGLSSLAVPVGALLLSIGAAGLLVIQLTALTK